MLFWTCVSPGIVVLMLLVFMVQARQWRCMRPEMFLCTPLPRTWPHLLVSLVAVCLLGLKKIPWLILLVGTGVPMIRSRMRELVGKQPNSESTMAKVALCVLPCVDRQSTLENLIARSNILGTIRVTLLSHTVLQLMQVVTLCEWLCLWWCSRCLVLVFPEVLPCLFALLRSSLRASGCPGSPLPPASGWSTESGLPSFGFVFCVMLWVVWVW